MNRSSILLLLLFFFKKKKLQKSNSFFFKYRRTLCFQFLSIYIFICNLFFINKEKKNVIVLKLINTNTNSKKRRPACLYSFHTWQHLNLNTSCYVSYGIKKFASIFNLYTVSNHIQYNNCNKFSFKNKILCQFLVFVTTTNVTQYTLKKVKTNVFYV